jgi:hypothetical protein
MTSSQPGSPAGGQPRSADAEAARDALLDAEARLITAWARDRHPLPDDPARWAAAYNEWRAGLGLHDVTPEALRDYAEHLLCHATLPGQPGDRPA